MKTCLTCREEKKETEFYLRRRPKKSETEWEIRRRNDCKACMKQIARIRARTIGSHELTPKQKQKAAKAKARYRKAKRWRNLREVLAALGNKCVDCWFDARKGPGAFSGLRVDPLGEKKPLDFNMKTIELLDAVEGGGYVIRCWTCWKIKKYRGGEALKRKANHSPTFKGLDEGEGL